MSKNKVNPKLEKIVESTDQYLSFAEVALEAHKRNISIVGYRLTKFNRSGEVIGNSIAINSFLADYNNEIEPENKFPWGEIMGYGGANRKVKCIRKIDLDKIVKALKKWEGKPVHKARRKTFKVFSEFANF